MISSISFSHHEVGILASSAIFSFVPLIHAYPLYTFNQTLIGLNSLLEHKEVIRRETIR